MSTITWLADLHGRARRRRQEPTPLPASEHRAMLLELRAAMSDDHPLVKAAEEMGRDAQQLLLMQAEVYERRLDICYAIIAMLAAVAFVSMGLVAWLLCPVLP